MQSTPSDTSGRALPLNHGGEAQDDATGFMAFDEIDNAALRGLPIMGPGYCLPILPKVPGGRPAIELPGDPRQRETRP
jgi:hypothetical protein